MGRPNEFTETVKNMARYRQGGNCACCGEDLTDLWEHAHHLRPVTAGGTRDLWNCAVLCDTCHYRIHNDGRYSSGVVAPEDYLPYLNGKH